jgi:hypothetical protein
MTSRMLINLRKATANETIVIGSMKAEGTSFGSNTSTLLDRDGVDTIQFARPERSMV